MLTEEQTEQLEIVKYIASLTPKERKRFDAEMARLHDLVESQRDGDDFIGHKD